MSVQLQAKHPGRVLVIDDERTVRLLVERVLTGAGHQVTLAEDGEAGLRALAASRFDLLIADKNLPGIDGLEVLRLARTHYPELRAILITAFPSPETEQIARTYGVDSYVTKPFGILELVAACDRSIAMARSGHRPSTSVAAD